MVLNDELKEHASEAARMLKSLSNENRLMILCSLIEGELSVSELNLRIPLSQSALSQHLGYLRGQDLVATRRESQTIYYQLKGDKAIQIIQVLQTIYCP
ncbi:MAG: metalloregulator ArsR/SmtB family transcription factor [Halioglobus sp.]